jgi:hypothetical protein
VFVFYFMEQIVGVIQALVFTLITAVNIGLLCNHEGGDHAPADGKPAPAADSSHCPPPKKISRRARAQSAHGGIQQHSKTPSHEPPYR